MNFEHPLCVRICLCWPAVVFLAKYDNLLDLESNHLLFCAASKHNEAGSLPQLSAPHRRIKAGMYLVRQKITYQLLTSFYVHIYY